MQTFSCQNMTIFAKTRRVRLKNSYFCYINVQGVEPLPVLKKINVFIGHFLQKKHAKLGSKIHNFVI